MLTRAWRTSLVCTFVLTAAIASAQSGGESASADPSELLPETQKPLHTKDYAGVVWWIPVEFWERAFIQHGTPAARAAEQVQPLRDYVMAAVVIGKLGPFGAINFIPGDQLRAKIFLRDAKSAEYAPLAKIGADAETLAAILKPVFANALGKMGESVEVMFFPARDALGRPVADPYHKGSFALVVRDLLGKPETVFEWQMPLTALSPPKYCPVGKERVNANWNYCPWHGVPLNDSTEPASKPAPPKPGVQPPA